MTRLLSRLAAACGYVPRAHCATNHLDAARVRLVIDEERRVASKAIAERDAALASVRDWRRLTEQHAAAVAEVARLRSALVECAAAVGGGASGSVSDDFLTLVPDEVRLVFARLTRERDEAVALLRRVHSGTLGWFDERDALLAKVGAR